MSKKKNEQKKTKSKNSFGKGLLWFIAIVVIALGVFVLTIKIANPSFDFKTLVPVSVQDVFGKAQEFIDEKIWSKETTEPTTEPTSPPPTTEPTTMPMMDYIEDSDFKFKTSVQGNQMGNLLNGGLVSTDMSYIYYYVQGEGIYRFVPSTEQYGLYFGIKDKISCINLRGDFIYYVNNKDDCLYKLQKNTNKPKKVAEDVAFAYVYDSFVYFTTTTGKVCIMDVGELIPVTAYYANGDDVQLVGVSLSRIFFTVTDFQGNVDYLTVDYYGHRKPSKFRESTDEDEIKKLHIENGFIYYYEQGSNGSYDLIRQKYGSEQKITLVKNAYTENYPAVDLNRLYFSQLKNGKYSLVEMNMNSGDKKVMLSVNNVKGDNTLSFYLGGEYNYIIGKRDENADTLYKASCIYTSSTNAMELKNGKWRY